MIDYFDLAKHEVVRLHEFLGAWFRGELHEDQFDQGFARVLHTSFENVQPAGVTLTRGDLLEAIEAGRGTNPEFRIEIVAPRVLGAWPGLILFQYVETQTGARASASRNKRLSTVLFEKAETRLVWRYLTEVGLPEQPKHTMNSEPH